MKTQISEKTGKTLFLFSLEEIQEADNDSGGFCLACGEAASGVEPDARKYECDSCGEKRVYGVGELALMGRVY